MYQLIRTEVRWNTWARRQTAGAVNFPAGLSLKAQFFFFLQISSDRSARLAMLPHTAGRCKFVPQVQFISINQPPIDHSKAPVNRPRRRRTLNMYDKQRHTSGVMNVVKLYTYSSPRSDMRHVKYVFLRRAYAYFIFEYNKLRVF